MNFSFTGEPTFVSLVELIGNLVKLLDKIAGEPGGILVTLQTGFWRVYSSPNIRSSQRNLFFRVLIIKDGAMHSARKL